MSDPKGVAVDQSQLEVACRPEPVFEGISRAVTGDSPREHSRDRTPRVLFVDHPDMRRPQCGRGADHRPGRGSNTKPYPLGLVVLGSRANLDRQFVGGRGYSDAPFQPVQFSRGAADGTQGLELRFLVAGDCHEARIERNK